MSFTGAADAQTAIGFLSLPTIKGENPVPGERNEWCKDVRARLGTCGGTCLLTKELPPAMEHATTLWDLDTVPEIIPLGDGSNSATVASRQALRAQYERENTSRTKLKESHYKDLSNRFATSLRTAFKENAETTWDQLAEKHKVGSTEYIDGVSLFLDYEKSGDAELDEDRADDEARQTIEELNANPPQSNCTGTEFGKYANRMREANKYLVPSNPPKKMVDWLIGKLPSELGGDGRRIVDKLAAAGKRDDWPAALKEIMLLLDKVHKPEGKGGLANAAQAKQTKLMEEKYETMLKAIARLEKKAGTTRADNALQMVRALVRVASTEQVLAQTVGAAGQGCGARATPASTHQGISLALGQQQAVTDQLCKKRCQ